LGGEDCRDQELKGRIVDERALGLGIFAREERRDLAGAFFTLGGDGGHRA
jgi:hypothetical protein